MPVWLAANGPQTGGLAGMIADGWIPMAFSTESYRGDLREVEW